MTKQKGGAIVDLGNVIIAHWLSNITPKNFHTIDYNSIPEVPGAFDSLKWLNDRFGGNAGVLSHVHVVQTWQEIEKVLNT